MPAEMEDIAGGFAIVGVGESAMSGASRRTSEAMSLAAIDAALGDAGLTPFHVDGLMIAGGLGGRITADDLRAHYGLRRDIWFSPEGGAFAQAATAPHTAWQAIRAGRARAVVSVVATDWASQVRAGIGGPAT